MQISRIFLPVLLLVLGVAASACTATEVPTGEPTPIPETSTAEPTMDEFEVTAVRTGEPIEVTYFTPSQQEGPYYPVDKPIDRDNDLVELAGATGTPAGEVLALSGIVYDASGLPVEGAVVEIWQTDNNGAYMHPQDPGTGQRDLSFQFYGEAITGADGVYSFRTILPGLYGSRPRHIHCKVKLDGEELLTTQFYFGNEVSFSGDEANLIIDMAPAEDDLGNPIWVGERDIILKIDL